jgi:hypothetical protein
MEKIFPRWTVAGVLALGLAGSPLLAQEKPAGKQKGSNQDKTTGKPAATATDPVSMAATAEQLARYGEEKKDPLALILAARIKQEVGENPVERKTETKGGQGDTDKPAKRDTSVQALIDKAKGLAQGRKDIVALADEVAKAETRGRASGPGRTTKVVRSGGMMVFHETFRGGEPAVVSISGDGDSDLDLFIYDENGILICRANSRSDDETCRWNPRWTGPFRIEVRNLGVANRFHIWSN